MKIMESRFEDYSTVWQECGPNGVAERFFVPGFDGFLPFFISGETLAAMKDGSRIELNERQLLEGILHGLYEFDHDHSSKPWFRQRDRNTLLCLLENLGLGFGFESGERMILDVAHSLRLRNGNVPSRRALLTGLKLEPFSSRIRSDLICDTWAVASDQDDRNLLTTIPEWVAQTSLDELLPEPKEIICYYGLCAMVLLNRNWEEIDSFKREFVLPNVALDVLMSNIDRLFTNLNQASALQDLRIA